MNIALKKIEINQKYELLVVPLLKGASFDIGMPEKLKQLLQKRQKDFKANQGASAIIYTDDQDMPARIMLFGLGKNINAEKARELGAQAVKALKQHLPAEIAFILVASLANYARELAEGMTLGNYNPAKYRTGKNFEKDQKADLKKITLLHKTAERKIIEQLELGVLTGNAVNEVRDMVNAPPAFKNVEWMVAKSKECAKSAGAKVTVLGRKEMEKLKMGGILGVSRGSAQEPKIVIMEYKPFGAPKEPIVFAGKGIIFDSGGYNLKPANSIRDMQLDMAGAAAVMGLFRLLKANKIRKHLIGIIALTDNLIGSKAQKPSDIIFTHSGHSVEITNTDAEGRLLLGDIVSYAYKKWNPKYLIDLATLTGACMIALGDRYAGLMGNDKALMEKLREAGDKSGELLWTLPLHPDYAKRMKSKIADYRNWDEIPYAGASKGGHFIGFFAPKNGWAHIDIAGPAFTSTPKKYESPMATGYGVRLLLQFLRDL